jgi:hypothetical protein
MHTLTVNYADVNTGQWKPNGLQHEKRDWSATDNPMFTSDNLRTSALVDMNRGLGCDVGSVAKIFVERQVHKSTHLTGIESSLLQNFVSLFAHAPAIAPVSATTSPSMTRMVIEWLQASLVSLKSLRR